MTIENIKHVLDALHKAKRISDMMPLLPDGVTPSYIRYLDIIVRIKREKGEVRVSDLSDALSVKRPGVTRTLNEMEKKGYLEKIQSEKDGRVTYISITPEGERLSKRYNEDVFVPLVEKLSSLSDEDALTVIKTIDAFYDAVYTEDK